MVIEIPEKDRKMQGIYLHQGEKIIEQVVVVAFYNNVCIMEQPFALVEIASESCLEIGVLLPELRGEFAYFLVKMICDRTLAEVYRVERIKFIILERKFYSAVICEFGEFIRHAEKAWTGIECESVLFQLVEPAAGIAVLLHNFNLVTSFCQSQCRSKASEAGTGNQYAFRHKYQFCISFRSFG